MSKIHTKKLSDVVEIPSEDEIIARHNLLMRHSGLHSAKKDQLEAIDFLKISYSDPTKIGIRAIDIRHLLNPHERKKLEDIHIRILSMFLDYYRISGKINISNFSTFTKKLDLLRWKKMIEYIRRIDSAIADHGIPVKGKLYRFMNNPFDSDTLHAFTSWSLYPLEEFCQSEKKCHLYIIEKFEVPVRLLYIELPVQELPRWEYEFLLPRGAKYKIVRSEKHKIIDPNFRRRETNRPGKIELNIHYIHITGIKKIKLSSIPKFETKTISYGD